MIPGFEKLVEQRIKEGQKEGKFDNLPQKGKKIEFEDDSFVPEEMRLAYKMLKNAGFVPPELTLRKEINSLTEVLRCEEDLNKRQVLMQKLNYLRLKLDMNCSSPSIDIDDKYTEKILKKFDSTK